MAQHTQDPDAIERDLQATRSRLDSRLSELAKRLSPGQILDEGLDLMRTRQGIDFTRNLSEAVRERPIPVALVSVGLAWLMATPRERPHDPLDRPFTDPRLGRPRVRVVSDEDLMSRAWNAGHGVVRQTGETDIDYRGRVTEVRGKVLGLVRTAQETTETYTDRVHDALFAARDRVGGAVAGVTSAASGASDKLGEMGGKLGDTMHNVGDRLSGGAHDLRDQASALGSRIGDQGRRLGDAASQGLRQARDATSGAGGGLMAAIGENPVLLGSLGLAVGALLGALLPPTEIEREYLGEAAHDARETIEGVVREATDRGADVAHAAMEAGRQTAQDIAKQASELGGTAANATRDVAGQAQQHASEMGEKATDAARTVAGQAANRPGGDGARPKT